MRRSLKSVIAVAALALCGAAPPRERLVSGTAPVAALLNGMPVRLRVDPAALSMPLISPALAARARLKPSFFEGEYQVGSRKVAVDTAVTRVDFGAGPQKRRVGWAAASFVTDADVVVGPGLLSEKVVRFQLRPQRAGERTARFPLVGQGGIEEAWGERFARIDVGGAIVRVKFDPSHRRTLATASAASRLAAAFGGAFHGEARGEEIAFGVVRPVRTMRLDRPLLIGPLAIATLGVRTVDFGSSRSIPEAGASPDADEIVVTGKGRKSKNVDQIRIGADLLDHCSSIVFDRTLKSVTLTCLPART